MGAALLLSVPALLDADAAAMRAGLWPVVVAVILMCLATLPHAVTPLNWVGVGIVALALLAAGPVGALLHTPRLVTPIMIAALCLAGACLGATAGLLEYFSGAGRSGVGNNPIHYAGIVVILGFSALAGFPSTRNPWRYLFFLGPACAFAAALVSGSRGPMLAAIALTAVTGTILLVWNRKDHRFLLAAGLFALAGGGAIYLAGDGARAISGLYGLISGADAGTAGSDTIRKAMYEAGVLAFLDSPVWGHGYANLMDAATSASPNGDLIARFDHLHNDVADFAVAGGALGIAAYAMLLLAPLMPLRRLGQTPSRPAILLGIVVSLSYLTLGMTNAMIGVLPQTMLFAVLVGAVIVLDMSERDPRALMQRDGAQ